jgi:hypothetical protein
MSQEKWSLYGRSAIGAAPDRGIKRETELFVVEKSRHR